MQTRCWEGFRDETVLAGASLSWGRHSGRGGCLLQEWAAVEAHEEMGTDQCKELSVLGGSFFSVSRHLVEKNKSLVSPISSLEQVKQGLWSKSRLAMFAFEASVLSSVLERAKEKGNGEMAASLLPLPSFQS